MNASPEYVLKIRGITLNWDVVVNQGMQYENFKSKVLNFANDECSPINIVYPNFLRPTVKRGSVITQPLKKLYKPFVGKGVLRPSDFTVLDYGFTSN